MTKRRSYPAKCKPRGSEIDHPEGYKLIYVPGHPLANAQGHVLVHRAVLWEKFGELAGLPTICHWCSRTIDWFGTGEYRLVADHLDDNPANNDPSNVVASCSGCNSYRSHSDKVVEQNRAKGISMWDDIEITPEDVGRWVLAAPEDRLAHLRD